MTPEDAIRQLRESPQSVQMVRNCYLDIDRMSACKRFLASGEFAAVWSLVKARASNGIVVDLGSGSGVATFAFASSGARTVYAVEPDPSDVVGRGAMREVVGDLPIVELDSYAESVPMPDQSVDVVYTRAMLHHASDLAAVMNECARVLAPGGLLLATREHVVDDEKQLAAFLKAHPLHHLVGNEHAYPLETYTGLIRDAGLHLLAELGPWDSVINAFPGVATEDELRAYPKTLLHRKLGPVGRVLGKSPTVNSLVMRRLNRRVPGRLYSFLAQKPET